MITELDLLFRALASRTRLRILALLRDAPAVAHQPPGLQPGELAVRLGIAGPTVSQHLRVLLRLRLVRFWKKDRRKFYRLARLSADSLRSRLLRRVVEGLPDRLPPVHPGAGPRAAGGHRPRTKPPRHGAEGTRALDGVWRLLTALSHFRRILILRHLAAEGPDGVAGLAAAADLRPATVLYHLRKLLRRGAVVREGGLYSLARTRASPAGLLPRPALLLPPGR